MFIWLKLTGFENCLFFFVSLRVFSNPDAEHGGGKSIFPNFVSALRPCYLLPLSSGVFHGSPGQELKTQYGVAMHTELNLCPIHLSPVDTEPNSNTSKRTSGLAGSSKVSLSVLVSSLQSVFVSEERLSLINYKHD